MKLKKLCKNSGIKPNPFLAEKEIASISLDSRKTRKGSLFIAIEGFKRDGRDFIDEALRKGAIVAVTEKPFRKQENIFKVNDARKALSVFADNFYGSPSKDLKVIGITGTNGKTTVSMLAKSILETSGATCGLIGTVMYKIGKKRIPAQRTTPDALLINELLRSMVREKCWACVMEVSSHALDQKRVDGIFYDAALFTNLTHEHMDYHGNIDHYFASKAKIFDNLKKGAKAILNADDKRVLRLSGKIRCRKITYGLDQTANISAKVRKAALTGSSFDVIINKKKGFSIDTELTGFHNISNILAAAAIGITQEIDLKNIKNAIEGVKTIPGRLQSVKKGQPFTVFVDYAHTHNALEKVLGFLGSMKKGKLITVFGCGGDRDREKRPLMGKAAQDFSDYVILTNDNPRSEDPENIIRDIERGISKKSEFYEVILDRRKAIEKALKKASCGDIVLIAGKGHEKEQIIGDETMPFDDRKVAEEILRLRTIDHRP